MNFFTIWKTMRSFLKDSCSKEAERKTSARRGFTLVESLVVAAILLTLVGLLWPAISAATTAKERDESEPRQSWSLSTEKHDGHWWVVAKGAATVPANFVHHPDCPCRTAEVER